MACLGLLSASSVRAQVFVAESFEQPPGTTYSLTTPFDDGAFDFFGRYAVPDVSNPARDDFQRFWHGSYGILSQDHDGAGAPTATVVVSMSGIDISGRSNLFVGALFGALAGEPAFFNYEFAHNDGIEFYVRIDGGARTRVGAFKPPLSGTGDLREDTTGDDVGDGARLTVDLALFSFPVAGTGSVMDLEIELRSTNDFEPIALDRVMVGEGDVASIFEDGFEGGDTLAW